MKSGIKIINITCVFTFIITGGIIITSVFSGFIYIDFQDALLLLMEYSNLLKMHKKPKLPYTKVSITKTMP